MCAKCPCSFKSVYMLQHVYTFAGSPSISIEELKKQTTFSGETSVEQEAMFWNVIELLTVR
eukprot:SAG11_NODE_639_length_8017_cov_4.086259_4_plen_61_part_00